MKQNRTQTIKQLLQYAVALMLLFIGVTACNKNDDMSPNGDQLAIQLTAYKPDDTGLESKAATKEVFVAGDKIHVSAAFEIQGGATQELYACMEYDAKGNWSAIDGVKFTWPLKATKATFTAYYIPNATSAMMDNAEVAKMSFSELSTAASTSPDRGDPLKATCTDVAVGGAVYLQFEHMCTKLTFTALGADISELRLSGNLSAGLSIRRAGGKITDSFLQPSSSVIINNAKSGEVSFLLSDIKKDEELKLSNIYTPYHHVVIPHDLELGKHYKLDITKLSDNGYSEEYKEEQWGKNPLPEIKFSAADIGGYLTAISNGEKYSTGGGVEILAVLKEGRKNVVTQLRDVDFDYQEFTPVNISTNIIFNGNGHTVKNVSISKDLKSYGALFGQNEGEIKNLILEDVSNTSTTSEYIGTLAAYNSGTIDNVKIRFEAGNVVHGTIVDGKQLWVGGLVGSNGGVIKNSLLSGKFTVTGVNQSARIANIGGLAGQSSGKVEGCAIHDVTAVTEGIGTFRTGGFIGAISEGSVYQCTVNGEVSVPDVVDIVRAGGFAGYSTANESMGAVKECSSNTTVTVVGANQASVGGFIGQIENSTIDNCHATGTVTAVTGTIQTPRGVAGLVGWLSYKGIGAMSRILNCSTISAVDQSSGALVGFVAENIDGYPKDENSKSLISNSFSKNLASSFVTDGDGVTINNWHHNGFGEKGTSLTVEELNKGVGSGGLQWTMTPNLYGVPYLNRTK